MGGSDAREIRGGGVKLLNRVYPEEFKGRCWSPRYPRRARGNEGWLEVGRKYQACDAMGVRGYIAAVKAVARREG
jgi:hypothetical protein